MKQLTPLAFALAAALPTAAQAQVYVGLDLAGGSGETEFEASSTYTQDIETGTAALKIGYVTQAGNRLQLSFTGIDAEVEDTDLEHEFSGIDFDAKFPFGESRVKPYLGIGLGLYTWEDTGDAFADGDDLSGIALNLSGGALFEVNDHFDLEAGLQIKAIGWQSIEPVGGGEEVDVTTAITQLMVGANVRF